MIIKIEKTKNFTIVCNEIFQNPEISARAKGIYGYIMTLPPNWHLQLTHIYNQFSEGRDAIKKALSELEEYGYIVKERVDGKDKSNGGWNITVFETSDHLLKTRQKKVPPTENPQLLIKKENTNTKTIVNSNINSNGIIDSKLKTEIRKLFSGLYESKTKEISDVSGKLPWGAKEASLLKADLETHGGDALKRYVFIFFSDKDKNIADFTRHRNGAGYSFGVFHGMLGKLALSKIKIKTACPHCGGVGNHLLDCKLILDKITSERVERNEINRLKDENKDYSLTDAFASIVSRKS